MQEKPSPKARTAPPVKLKMQVNQHRIDKNRRDVCATSSLLSIMRASSPNRGRKYNARSNTSRITFPIAYGGAFDKSLLAFVPTDARKNER